MADSWIVIGVVKSVNPSKRLVRVNAEPRHAHQFDDMARVRLRTRDGTVKDARITEIRATEQGVLLTLEAGVTRDTVAGMRNAKLIIAPDEAKPRPAGVYVREDFPGMAVADEHGDVVGIVRDAFSTPAHFVIEIGTPTGDTILAPVVDALVRAIDLDARRITVGDISAFVWNEDADDED